LYFFKCIYKDLLMFSMSPVNLQIELNQQEPTRTKQEPTRTKQEPTRTKQEPISLFLHQCYHQTLKVPPGTCQPHSWLKEIKNPLPIKVGGNILIERKETRNTSTKERKQET